MEPIKGEGIWTELCEIEDGPGPYTMSYGFNLDPLCESIRKVGLINPPLVARNRKGSMDVVSGYRRVLALRALGETKALCKDVTSALPTPLERFLANFYENLATRDFNDIEKALVLNKLQSHFKNKEIVASFMPLLCLPSHEGTLKFYLKLLDLEESIQSAISGEEISISVAKALVEMEKGSRQVLFNWIKKLKFNINQQSKFIEYIKEICMREDLTPSELLSEASFFKAAESPRLNNPQKAKAVLEGLRVRRFPRLAEAQQAVKTTVSGILLPPETSIRYDPYLEDPYYQLEIRFKQGRDLKNAINQLHASHELETIPELWAGK